MTNCVAAPSGANSCYASDPSTMIRSGIAGSALSFTSTPSSLDPGPNLLVTNGGWVIDIDPDSMTPTQLVAGAAADSAD